MRLQRTHADVHQATVQVDPVGAGNVAYRGCRGPSAQHQGLHLGDHRVAQQRGSRDR